MRDYNKNNFPIYSKEDSLTYAKCPFRGEVFLPNYKPEEKVRLSFIYFLCNCIDIFPQLVDIKVESDRLDLSLYNKTLGEISNYAPPVLIIETKREDYNLIQANGQLVEYLKRNQVENGLLFNSNQAFSITRILDKFECHELHVPSEIVSFIITSISNQNTKFEEEKILYSKAKDGDFDSFKTLAKKHWRNKRITFRTTHNGNEHSIEGHLFDFFSDFVKYVRCGFDSKSENKPFFYNNEFLALENIQRY